MARFDLAIDKTLQWEGGYSAGEHDPGGETNFGISARSYPDLNIKALTCEDAIAIYKRDFWRYDAILDQPLASKLFDMAVNVGSLQAHRLIQRALGLPADGICGPQIIEAINACDPDQLLLELRATLAEFYCRLVMRKPSQKKWLRGWLRRAVS